MRHNINNCNNDNRVRGYVTASVATYRSWVDRLSFVIVPESKLGNLSSCNQGGADHTDRAPGR